MGGGEAEMNTEHEQRETGRNGAKREEASLGHRIHSGEHMVGHGRWTQTRKGLCESGRVGAE